MIRYGPPQGIHRTSNPTLAKMLLFLRQRLTAGSISWRPGLPFVLNPDFRQPVAQSIARKPEQASCLRFVSACALQGFANHFVFPLIERHTVREKAVGGCGRR